MITALEFYAVHRRVGRMSERVKRAKPVRNVYRQQVAP
jgi:hypothetical protein